MSTDYFSVRAGGARHQRTGNGLDFERLAFFVDAVFAISLTLIVVDIGLPVLADASSATELRDALWDLLPEFASFVIGVFVIGNYWSAHHRFFAAVEAVDTRFVGITIAYLGCVAFLPFPIRLVGAYDHNPLSVVVFALNLAAVSCAEVLQLRRAWRADLLRTPRPTRAYYRWLVAMSFQPVVLFLLSIPVAFVNTYLAIAVWALSGPVQFVLQRYRPEEYAASPQPAPNP